MQAHTAQPNLISMAITVAIVGIVLYFRMRRLSRERPLKLEQLWIIPAIYAAIVALTFWALPPTVLVWGICVAALAIGGALGWQRGRLMRISVDPETHALNQKASPAAVVFLILLVLVRQGAAQMARFDVGGLHINPQAVTDVLLAFVLGVFAVQRIEMYLRAKRLLEDARAGRVAQSA